MICAQTRKLETALVFSIVRAECLAKAKHALWLAEGAHGAAREIWLDVAGRYSARAASYEAAMGV